MMDMKVCPRCGNGDLEEYNDYGVVYYRCRVCGWDEKVGTTKW